MTYTIKDWNTDDRPREKLIGLGSEVLSDAELIAIILRSGNRNKDAVALGREILGRFGNSLQDLLSAPVEKIMQIEGVGETKAASIKAALELGTRACRKKAVGTAERIHSSDDIAAHFIPRLGMLKHEEFWAVFLDRGNMVIRKERISSGGTFSTVVDIKIIVKKAVDLLSNSIIVVHNHPSGTRNPGEHDKNVTRKLASALDMMEIRLLDHIIVTDNGFFSFADSGLL